MLIGKNVLLRCGKCGALNSIPEERIAEHPKCGKCGNYIYFPTRPVDATTGSFGREVLEWPGVVMVEFWAAW
ncbi:MAG TPA: hypothetical protein VK435_01825 [Thermodesulfovibrionales bacterium]|nr:hypothetical protein [Thermodesulfovibrionales bacterium]